jgi:hypothetical protein
MTTQAALVNARWPARGAATAILRGNAAGEGDAVPDEITLTRQTFADRVGETFTVRLSDEHGLALTLDSVSALPHGSNPDTSPQLRREPFSLVFRGPLDAPLAQHTYTFEHPALGAIDIFIVPITPSAEGRLYEAIFT